MGMISDNEARKRGICVFCERQLNLEFATADTINIYEETALCPYCYKDFLEFDGHVKAFKERKRLKEEDHDMISEAEAQKKGICMFCEKPVKGVREESATIYSVTSLCLSCRNDLSKMDAIDLSKGEQIDFKLSSGSPIPIDVPGATNMGWLILNHPKVFIGSHITCENYGLSVKFTIIPPTREAGERIVNTMRTDRETRNRKLRPGHKNHAPARYTL